MPPRKNGTEAETPPRARKEKASERLESWPPPPVQKSEEDELSVRAEQAIIMLLTSDLDAKDMNAAIANAIRLIQIKKRFKPDDEEGTVTPWDDD